MLKRTLIIAGLVVGITTLSSIVTQCYADTTTTNCRHSYIAGVTCSTTTIESAPPVAPRPLSLNEERAAREYDALLAREAQERDAKWVQFCKPVIELGSDGINRYRYAHRNCDMGRIQ